MGVGFDQEGVILMAMMTVICKHCGAENQKDEAQYVVKCTECGKETCYLVQPWALRQKK